MGKKKEWKEDPSGRSQFPLPAAAACKVHTVVLGMGGEGGGDGQFPNVRTSRPLVPHHAFT